MLISPSCGPSLALRARLISSNCLLSGLWSTISSNCAPPKKRFAFFTAQTTARNSISVAEYLDSVRVMWREQHWIKRHFPVGSYCQSAMPRPLDCAEFVSTRRGYFPLKCAETLRLVGSSIVFRKASSWGFSQTKTAVNESNGRRGVNRSVRQKECCSNCCAKPQKERTSVLLTGVGKSVNARIKRSQMR